jgi:hypothetical protein
MLPVGVQAKLDVAARVRAVTQAILAAHLYEYGNFMESSFRFWVRKRINQPVRAGQALGPQRLAGNPAN